MNLSGAIFENTKYLLLGIWNYGESIRNYENIFTEWTRIFIYQIMELKSQNKKIKFLGIITLKEIKNIPKKDSSKAADILVPHNKKREVSADSDVVKALELMIKEDKGRIIVMENETIVDLITRNGLARYLQIMGK